ncbi:hypothetical protein [Azospirillum largimobile]
MGQDGNISPHIGVMRETSTTLTLQFLQGDCLENEALLPLWGGIGQTPTAYCRPAGWDEGCSPDKGREGRFSPSPQPLSHEGRGAHR